MTAVRNHLSPAAESRRSPRDGVGAFARNPLHVGEFVACFGGRECRADELSTMSESICRRSLQIDDDVFLVGADSAEPGESINHSCEPNCGPRGATVIVALRDIAVGEELTFDYGTMDGSSYDEFICHCGSDSCRGRVLGTDWRRLDLRRRHGESFSPYLLRRMNSHRYGRPLTKADVENLLRDAEHSPTTAVTTALGTVFARPWSTFDELIDAAQLPSGLTIAECRLLRERQDRALDDLVARLNEERGRDLRRALEPIPVD